MPIVEPDGIDISIAPQNFTTDEMKEIQDAVKKRKTASKTEQSSQLTIEQFSAIASVGEGSMLKVNRGSLIDIEKTNSIEYVVRDSKTGRFASRQLKGQVAIHKKGK